ncbi:MAG TPA: hypothetical protein VGG62_12130 [Terracidiphilus sp.]|jgi:hypothetical protein
MGSDTVTNPFHVWADLARGLRDRFVSELGEERPFAPQVSEIVGILAGTVTRLEHLGNALDRLSERDNEAYEAFARALEKS